MTKSAYDKRQDAITAMVNDLCPESNGYIIRTLDKDEIINLLVTLYPLGKTARWKVAIDRVIGMVKDATSDSNLDWAVKQGSIYLSAASA